MPDQPAIILRPPTAESGDGSHVAFVQALAAIAVRLATMPQSPVPSSASPKEER